MDDPIGIPFRDRRDAGRQLAARLMNLASRPDVLVLGLPRGGIPVGYEVALALHAPLDAFFVRKLGVPGHEELAMGAIASGGLRTLNEDVLRDMHVSVADVEAVEAAEEKELSRREHRFRGDRPALDVEGKIVVLVDDGLATGSTMRVAIDGVRRLKPQRIVVAVPVAAVEICEAMRQHADEVVCLNTPRRFAAVGLWYDNFDPTTDEEVIDLLSRSTSAPPASI